MKKTRVDAILCEAGALRDRNRALEGSVGLDSGFASSL